MNNSIFKISMLLLISGITYAEVSEPFSSKSRGIQYIPANKMNMPKEFRLNVIKKMDETPGLEYVESNNNYIDFLLGLRQTAPQEMYDHQYANEFDTHLKKNVSNIKLAISFVPILSTRKNHIIEFAPVGSYIQEDQKNNQLAGWSGIVEFFSNPELGNCAYTLQKILAVQLDPQNTSYFVNKKPSNKMIEGNPSKGFLYNITWYTDNTMSVFECANHQLDPHIMQKMIILATKVDQ